MLLEPAFDDSTYESKYLPLMMKYLDSNSLSITVFGSRNSVDVIKREFKNVYSIPVYPKASAGARMFIGYISYLLFSFLMLVKFSQKINCSALLSLGGHPYTGFVVSLAAKISNKKAIVRISEPTRIIIGGRYKLGLLLDFFVRITEFLSFYFSDLIITNRDMCWYNTLICRKQTILSQGVDVSRFNGAVGAAFRKDMFPIVITVARLDRQKNIKSVIEAVALLRAKYPRIYYYVVGSGPDEQELKVRVEQLGVSRYVNFYSYVSPDKIPYLLNSADFFVLPSLVEGLPSAVLEAMSCGLPTILASTDYSCQGLFTHEKNVLLVDGNSKSIADAIDRLARDSQLRSKLIDNGQHYVKECHNSCKTKKLFAESISKLLVSTTSKTFERYCVIQPYR